MTDFTSGVASQGVQVCSLIATYIGSLKDRDEDLASISRQAQGLESVFQTIREFLIQGSLDPSTSSAAAHVLSSVQTCEVELNSLKQLVARFSNSLSPKARPQDKIIQQAQKLKYPFQRSEISRIQRSLGVIKETLDLTLQNLELRYNHLATSKLINFEEASRQASNSLNAKLDSLLERFPQDTTTVAAVIDEPDPRISVYRLASKPSNLAELCGSLENHNENVIPTINALQRAPAFNTSSCPCHQHQIHRTKQISWLSWDFWDNEILCFEHYKGCKYFRRNGNERSRVRGVRFTSFVKDAVIVTFNTRTGAGGHSLGANLQYYATVDRKTSPAFCVISVLWKGAEMLQTLDKRQPNHQIQWERLVLAANQKLESVFRLSKAGAKDVDSRNRSLLHATAEVANMILFERYFFKGIEGIEEAYSLPIARLARFLIKKQVSASLRDLNGEQAFITALGHEPLSIPLAEAFCPDNADIHAIERSNFGRHLDYQDLADYFKCFATIPRVAEVIHGPLSVAVLLNDQDETCRLLRKHPEFLEEREYRSGQTPFHLALRNPRCLRILVEKCDPRLLVRSDNSGYTILGYAILLSKTLCDRREDQDDSSCRCTLPLRILLEGGCPIIPYLDFKRSYDGSLIASASLHCKVCLAKSLLQRRQELKSIAQQYLSPLEIENFSLHRPLVLDIYAMQIDKILRHRGIIEFGSLTTYLEEDNLPGQSPVQDYWSIYHHLSTAEDADVYFGLGFHDITVRPDKPERCQPSHGGTSHISLPFVKWLLDHDAPLYEWVQHWSLPWTGFTADAFILAVLCCGSVYHVGVYEGDEDDEGLVRQLEERILLDHSVDDCYCGCSPGGCTPFVVKMKHMDFRVNELNIATIFTAYLKEYGNALRREHYYAAIRFLTFHALGIAHTCVCNKAPWSKLELDAEEIAEIQDEYRELLEVLESLIEEFETYAWELFEAATDELDSMITFWNGYWVRRMTQVLSELSQTNEANKSAAEDLGVIWGPEPERDIYQRNKREDWDYYFQRIEEIE